MLCSPRVTGDGVVVARLRIDGDVVEDTEVLRAGEEDDAVARVEGKSLGTAASDRKSVV